MRTCWLCGKNGANDPLDRHHLFGGGNRRKSEKLGLVVDLCHGSCHIFGERAAHRCRETAQALHEYGQRMAMERMGWSTEEFVREFGRNYLDEANVATEQNGQPFLSLIHICPYPLCPKGHFPLTGGICPPRGRQGVRRQLPPKGKPVSGQRRPPLQERVRKLDLRSRTLNCV